MKDLIKKLTETYGPSGSEDTIREIIRNEVVAYADEVRVDALGNLIAVKKGSKPKIMLAAHMDEIGIIVTFIEDKGFLRFANVGGVFPFTLFGQRVIFANGIVGTFGVEKPDELKELKVSGVKLSKMFIDIGAKDRGEAERLVRIGDVASFHREMTDLGARLISKAMDDRIGCVVLIETLKRVAKEDLDNEIYFVFTVQEEVGIRGARTAAYGIDPDIGIAVDVTLTGDTPEAPTMAVKLGGGPAVKVKDMSVISHPKVKNLMVKVAEEEDIPYQLEVLEQGGTDAGSIHLTREGIPSGVLSIPARYVHTPSEMVDFGDVENAVRLLVGILRRPLVDIMSKGGL